MTRLVENASAPLELRAASGLHLFARQIVQVVDGHCRTESYSYRLQATKAIESWLIRWESYRDRPPLTTRTHSPTYTSTVSSSTARRSPGSMSPPVGSRSSS